MEVQKGTNKEEYQEHMCPPLRPCVTNICQLTIMAKFCLGPIYDTLSRHCRGTGVCHETAFCHQLLLNNGTSTVLANAIDVAGTPILKKKSS